LPLFFAFPLRAADIGLDWGFLAMIVLLQLLQFLRDLVVYCSGRYSLIGSRCHAPKHVSNASVKLKL